MPKLTVIIPKEVKEKLEKISTEDNRSYTATIQWLINSYYDIRYCFVCKKRKDCEEYKRIVESLKP